MVAGGVMYVSTPLNHVVALDAATGRKLWEYAETLSTTVHCCGPVNRGVAVYGGRIYMGTLDGRLVALDARTGRPVWRVRVADNERAYAIDGAPVAADGKVIVGISGAEYGIRGFVTAYDAATGALVWRFYTIPSPGGGRLVGPLERRPIRSAPRSTAISRASRPTAPRTRMPGGPAAARCGRRRRWIATLGLVIFGVGNASPDLDGSVRPGDNLYTASVVAVDLGTGKLRWYFQELPHDIWDLDAASPVVLVDFPGAGGDTVRAVAQAGKTGWVYVLDRATGRPIRRSDRVRPAGQSVRPADAGGRAHAARAPTAAPSGRRPRTAPRPATCTCSACTSPCSTR